MIKTRYPAPSFLRAVSAISRVTFLEIMRDRILYNVLILGAILLGLSYLASRLTYVREERILLDFGITGLQITTVAVGVLIGSNLLNREQERRTIWLALSRPISMTHFVLGKYFGLSLAILVNSLLIAFLLLIELYLSLGEANLNFNSTLVWAVALSIEQAMLAAAIAIFFSSFATTSVSVVLSFGTILIGSSINQIYFAASRADTVIGAAFLNAVGRLVPNFEAFHLGTQLTYGLPIPIEHLAWTTLYTALVSGGALALAVLIGDRMDA